MSLRDTISSRLAPPDKKRRQMLENYLDALDKSLPVSAGLVVEVLTMILATVIAAHAHNRECGEDLIEEVEANLTDMLDREYPPETKH